MPTPEKKLYLYAGGHPLVKIKSLSVPFPTREIEERQLITPHNGTDAAGDYGWEIEFKRNDAYGSAIIELDENLFPMLVEHCPDVTNEYNEEADTTPVTISETSNPISFTAEPACVGLAVIEDP